MTITIISNKGLPKTGQTIVYTAGDDGTYQKGYTIKGIRFIDNGDGTITDNATGLMWQKVGNGFTGNWQAAINYAEALTLAGHTDWRMPNFKELMSILDYSKEWICVDPVFTNTAGALYWSSTTKAGSEEYAWFIHFGVGYSDYIAGYKEEFLWIRCVRGGKP